VAVSYHLGHASLHCLAREPDNRSVIGVKEVSQRDRVADVGVGLASVGDMREKHLLRALELRVRLAGAIGRSQHDGVVGPLHGLEPRRDDEEEEDGARRCALKHAERRLEFFDVVADDHLHAHLSVHAGDHRDARLRRAVAQQDIAHCGPVDAVKGLD